MEVNQLTNLIHDEAVKNGYWDEYRNFPTIIALCHSELSEALQADRKHEGFSHIIEEMGDALIRILDWFGNENVNVEEIIMDKLLKNTQREYKNGAKY